MPADRGSPPMIYSFGDFELNDRLYELRRGGELVPIEPKVLELLCYLIRHREQLVPKGELLDHLWSGRIVGDTSLSRCISSARHAVGDSAAKQQIIQTVYGRGFRFIAPVHEEGSADRGSLRSLAVLPLENLSGDPEQEYFADGMTEALIGDLAKIRSLRVISRTSVMPYKRVRKPLPEIARELSVDAVIEGTVTREDDRVRVAVQLIDARADDHLWSERYDGELRHLLSLQSAIARAVAEQIELELTPGEQALLPKTRALDPAAHDAYLRGVQYRAALPPELEKAVACFERALEVDPGYAAAWVALAGVHFGRATHFLQPVLRDAALPKARSAALEACRLDPALGAARAMLGLVHLYYDRDWVAAGRELRRAFELSPNDPNTLQAYSVYLTFAGRHDEATALLQRAIDVSPLDPGVRLLYARSFYYARRYDRALAEYRVIVERDPDAVAKSPAGATLAWTYWMLGQREETYREFDRRGRSVGGSAAAPVVEAAKRAHAQGGALAGIRAGTEARVEQVARGSAYSPYIIGILYAMLDEPDLAFDWLERACDERDPLVADLAVQPLADPLRSDPRFAGLLGAIQWPGGDSELLQ